ncbi:ABC transporter ATP-binding protein [Pelagimonas varians]|uniref:Lipid A export ATP-binding/permease protein MsbA n=1 Tax=Pelagimonas varians TaxID=696760 RepID=A0A238KGI5_9RHOB|nr:ABC transporter ATP-binding protein [Pelagimonas varians]PYG32299.1 ATP-binding cassette subfamily B protein [Pelagimonas varians]SMX41953.1 Lipid A export ATP-binding/permease protein MsbA [Pelagimonas varians]
MSTKKEDSSWVLFTWLWTGYLKKYVWYLAAAMGFMMFEGAMTASFSVMMKPLFDDVFLGSNADALVWVGLAVLGIFVARGLASLAHKIILTSASQRSMADIRNDMVDHLMRLDADFHSDRGPGNLIQRVEGDVGAIAKVWRTLVTGAGRDAVTFVALLGVAFWSDWRWTLIALVGVPLMIGPASYLQKFVRTNARKNREISASQSTRLNEIFHGIMPVKLNQLERYQSKQYQKLQKIRIRTEVRSAAGSASLPTLIDVMSGLGFFGILYFAGGEILEGKKTVGEFMTFFTAIGMMFEPLRRLGAVSGAWQIAAAGIERVKDLLETPSHLIDPPKPADAPDGLPSVSLDDVRLNYEETEVLRGLNFVAEAGKTTALVGPSGAGKSTVFHLLTRLVDPSSGRIEIGGVSPSDLSLHDLRSMISVVSQEAMLFDESLRENIVLDQDVSDERLQAALEAAHITSFLPKLANGIETRVGPRGSNLSGGQRQRVAIARALLRDTPILLLDEATSALDVQSEAVVQSALDKLAEGRTTLVIAHRLSTVRNADKIVVMDAGRAVQEGSHDALLAKGGVYADLCRLQFGGSTT